VRCAVIEAGELPITCLGCRPWKIPPRRGCHQFIRLEGGIFSSAPVSESSWSIQFAILFAVAGFPWGRAYIPFPDLGFGKGGGSFANFRAMYRIAVVADLLSLVPMCPVPLAVRAACTGSGAPPTACLLAPLRFHMSVARVSGWSADRQRLPWGFPIAPLLGTQPVLPACLGSILPHCVCHRRSGSQGPGPGPGTTTQGFLTLTVDFGQACTREHFGTIL